MIRHIVLTKFKTDVTDEQVNAIYSELAKLTEQLSGASGFIGGRSKSPEQIERGYMHGFSIDFDSWEDLRHYAENAQHKILGKQLVDNAVDGIDGLLVLDIEV